MHPHHLNRAQRLVELLQQRGQRVTLAESCTGGLIAACLTSIAGSSAVFRDGWVSYSAEAKQRDLGIPAEIISREGLVSEPIALAMARGALARSSAHYALGITGNAGPTSEPGLAPVGQACLALHSRAGRSWVSTITREGLERLVWRDRIVSHALDALIAFLISD